MLIVARKHRGNSLFPLVNRLFKGFKTNGLVKFRSIYYGEGAETFGSTLISDNSCPVAFSDVPIVLGLSYCHGVCSLNSGYLEGVR